VTSTTKQKHISRQSDKAKTNKEVDEKYCTTVLKGEHMMHVLKSDGSSPLVSP